MRRRTSGEQQHADQPHAKWALVMGDVSEHVGPPAYNSRPPRMAMVVESGEWAIGFADLEPARPPLRDEWISKFASCPSRRNGFHLAVRNTVTLLDLTSRDVGQAVRLTIGLSQQLVRLVAVEKASGLGVEVEPAAGAEGDLAEMDQCTTSMGDFGARRAWACDCGRRRETRPCARRSRVWPRSSFPSVGPGVPFGPWNTLNAPRREKIM